MTWSEVKVEANIKDKRNFEARAIPLLWRGGEKSLIF